MDPIDSTFGVVLILLLIYKFLSTKGQNRYKFLLRYMVLIIIVELSKNIIGRLRPDKSDYKSFPSGHSANAWFIAASYDFNIFLVIWAFAVMISRISLRRHDIFDVFGGAILGITCAKININKIIQIIMIDNQTHKSI
jgi:membrane-associated phospholipid phosphatase